MRPPRRAVYTASQSDRKGSPEGCSGPGETANSAPYSDMIEPYDKHNETGPEGPVPDGELVARREALPPHHKQGVRVTRLYTIAHITASMWRNR